MIIQPRNPPDLAQGQISSDASSTYREERHPDTSSQRRSRRIQGKAPLREKDHSGRAHSGAYALLFGVWGSDQDHFDDFLDTFWPDHPDDPEKEHLFKAVYAVFAASVLGNRVSRKGALNLPRVHQNNLPPAPKHWNDLRNHDYGALFEQDAKVEIDNIEARKCWRIIDRGEAKSTLIPLKWVFHYKVDGDGFLTRCRSRIVVRGDLQPEETIISTYAATLAARSFRVAMAIAARFDLEINQFDVVNAFVNAVRDSRSEPVNCKLPPGFQQPGKAVEIDRALYGLRDSPALWYQDFSTTLIALGLKACAKEPCIYFYERRKIMVVFFVDDVLVLYQRDKAQEIIAGLNKAYKLHDIPDFNYFLGIRVIRDRAARKISMVHDTYIEKIAKKFGQDSRKCPSTPLPPSELVPNGDKPAEPSRVKAYQEMVGSILYTAIMVRPDIAYAASALSRYLTNPSPQHMAAAKWTIAYLWGTRFLCIEFGGQPECQRLLMIKASLRALVIVKPPDD